MPGAFMAFRFDETARQNLSDLCAKFIRDKDDAESSTLKRAAVSITVVGNANGDGDAAFLLTRRAARLRSHSAQWALPGGRCDPGESAVETALRELHEELGLQLAPSNVLGLIDDYPTRSGYLITPVIMWSTANPDIHPNPDEISSVHRIPLSEIAEPDAVNFVSIAESDRPVVRIRIEGDFIHAPTAAILYQFRELLAGRLTRVAQLEQPTFAWR
jgi:8-oxo-dGTP pyrophosphatase MutT (NUDIX family)